MLEVDLTTDHVTPGCKDIIIPKIDHHITGVNIDQQDSNNQGLTLITHGQLTLVIMLYDLVLHKICSA